VDTNCVLSRAGLMHVPDIPVGGTIEEEPHFVRGREGRRAEEEGRRCFEFMPFFTLSFSL